jgi:hypothetical protein
MDDFTRLRAEERGNEDKTPFLPGPEARAVLDSMPDDMADGILDCLRRRMPKRGDIARVEATTEAGTFLIYGWRLLTSIGKPFISIGTPADWKLMIAAMGPSGKVLEANFDRLDDKAVTTDPDEEHWPDD